ncbi:hypothetical protein GOBAR_AA39140 [Gossypium barbadense]|uniref:Uncharacterized protein n=1 Tax=Gossypium barbadense TaxID=3634 RepID=A0A2P5VRV8_GOSBA|nr:hypothetical protein GOBAR_AA39140 [Gossypium barbadense]
MGVDDASALSPPCNRNIEYRSIVSSRYVGSIISKNSSHGLVVKRARIVSAIWTCSKVAQSMQWPAAKVRPEVFGRAFLKALVETVGEGDEFPRLDPRKMTLPSSSSSWYDGFLSS